ncbi:cobyric acid synthase [Caldivirga maquilingensis]|uniref:Probable cobyric acid synthase n=1 Tax=Caldivirga maquilingensis (strain ATCC 700844 / DSM 13496 / JCM 10307 / IC-167) TaxID=397948 RepID=A8MAR3_CALMQ|nr:cobyric acid synthase [Caldivirga maquilingensis]ABW01099.1 cobyric acid synthase CobQ [Caldivirga maquilingensis IC-167]
MKKSIYILATQSNSGKTILVTALLRLVNRRSRVASPFKAQNMSLNSYPALNGGEIALAQAMQAYASGLEPLVEMNPILLKPIGDMASEVIVMGRPVGLMEYREYSRNPLDKWRIIRVALGRLMTLTNGLIIGEGAGSAYEPNITNDVANFRPADYLNADVYVALDISRGGAFTSALGLYNSVPVKWRELIKGFIINRFRGDSRILNDAVKWLEEKTGRRVVGVIPEINEAHYLWPEDSEAMVDFGNGSIDVAVVSYPGISNFHEFNVLAMEDVHVRFVKWPDSLGEPDLLVLPGAKNTALAMDWLRRSGLDRKIVKMAGSTPILAICGGFQLLTEYMSDPTGVEFGNPGHVKGLGLIKARVVYREDKIVAHSKAMLNTLPEKPIRGYEIRRGRLTYNGDEPGMIIIERNSNPVNEPDGYFNEDRRIFATSLHDVLSNPEVRGIVLTMAKGSRVTTSEYTSISALLHWIDELAAVINSNLTIDL